MKSNMQTLSLLLATCLLLTGCNQSPITIPNPTVSIPTLTVPPQEKATETPSDWIQSLQAAKNHDRLILVAAEGTDATISYHQKGDDGAWSEVFSVPGHVGEDGIGEAAEDVSRTPVGLYHFTMAFGKQPDPGCPIGYTQVGDSDYWVDDPASAYYNQFVNTDNTEADWNSAEPLASSGDSYDYVLALDYNSSCVPGKGSAIFLHCYAGIPSQGCITMSPEAMVTVLQTMTPDTAIIIDAPEQLSNY